MKYTFKSKSNYDNSELTLEFEAEQLDDVLSHFNTFLRASGFEFDGYLGVVYDEEVYSELIEDSPDYEINSSITSPMSFSFDTDQMLNSGKHINLKINEKL